MFDCLLQVVMVFEDVVLIDFYFVDNGLLLSVDFYIVVIFKVMNLFLLMFVVVIVVGWMVGWVVYWNEMYQVLLIIYWLWQIYVGEGYWDYVF